MQSEEATKIVNFACSDGSSVPMTELAGYVLSRTECVKNIRVVVSHGRRYYYVTPIEDEEKPLWKWLARRVYLLELNGDGEIHHDGSDSFLPVNFYRDEWPEHHVERERPKRPLKAYTPKPGVGPTLISQQLEWLTLPALRQQTLRIVAKRTNPAVSEEIVQSKFAELIRQIQGGQCQAKNLQTFTGYVVKACEKAARGLAKQGKLNGDVIPCDLNLKVGVVSLTGWENLCDEPTFATPTRTTSLSSYDKEN